MLNKSKVKMLPKLNYLYLAISVQLYLYPVTLKPVTKISSDPNNNFLSIREEICPGRNRKYSFPNIVVENKNVV